MKVLKRKMPPVPMAQNNAPRAFSGNIPERKTVYVPVISGTFSSNIQTVPVTVPREPWEVQP